MAAAGTLLVGIVLGVGAAVAWAKLSAPDGAAKPGPAPELAPQLWISNALDWDAGQSDDTPTHAGTETRNPPEPRPQAPTEH